ncbi:hypothetical protein BLA29_015533, partial [Euroglyphus maynei]
MVTVNMSGSWISCENCALPLVFASESTRCRPRVLPIRVKWAGSFSVRRAG